MSETQAFWFTVSLFAAAFIMAARMSRWHLLQMVVFAGVMCAGIYWEWTIGGYATAIVGGLVALIVTLAVNLVVLATISARRAVTKVARAFSPTEAAKPLARRPTRQC